MEDYAEAKSKLFTMCNNSIINADSEWSHVMFKKSRLTYTYGIDSDECDFKAINIKKMPNCVEYDLIYSNL
jgi:UDP-N-acetylmuramoyl-L-alanyl-D-glutamate--2,6-diaminopimelate ligase